MALDVYFREDIANILMGHLMGRPDWHECLEAVGRSVGVNLLLQEFQEMKMGRWEGQGTVRLVDADVAL